MRDNFFNDDGFREVDYDSYTHLDKNTRKDELSEKEYNLWIGGMVGYGLILSAIIGFLGLSFIESLNPVVFLIGYFVSAITGIIIAKRSTNWKISFLGYNLVVLPLGVTLSILLYSYSMADVNHAFLITGLVVATMVLLSQIKPDIFKGMGRTLFVMLLLGIVFEVIALLIGFSTSFFDFFFIVVFSLYLGYDWQKAQDLEYTRDNAVDVALDIYLDIFNLFIRILSILGRSNNRRK